MTTRTLADYLGTDPTTLGPRLDALDAAQPMPNATHGLLRRIAGDQNASIVVCSDSTGAGIDRWPCRIGSLIAAHDPTVRVEYRAWNDTTKVYGNVTVITPGSGGPTVTIWNAAVPGRQVFYQHGQHFEAAYGQATADWVIVNHGHNHDWNWPAEVHAALLVGAGQQLAMRHPHAGISIVAQNPIRASTQGTNRAMGAQLAARMMGWSLIDVFGLYQAEGAPAAWYDPSDTTHPSVAPGGGEDAILSRLIAPTLSNRVSQQVQRDPTLSLQAANLLANGTFAAWTGGVPDGWAPVNCTAAQETALYETAGRAARLTNTAATGAQLRQVLSGDTVRALRGRAVTVACRTHIPAANTSAVCGPDLKISSNGGSTYGTSRRGFALTNGNGRGGYIWLSTMIFVPMDATHLQVDTAGTGTGSGQQLIVDRISLVPGALPMDSVF